MKTTFWNTFSAAPHRLFFFSGAVQLILPALLWSIELSGRYTELWPPLEMMIPATWAHGFVMIYGLFIFFIFGFLMTVFPRWMGGPLIAREDYVNTFIWMNTGLLVFELSLFLDFSSLFAGIIIYLSGWLYGTHVLYKSFRAAPPQNKRYEIVLLCALLAGSLGIASYAWWLYSDNWLFIQLALNIGIWLFLVPILFTVSHRMIPFFSSNVIDNYSIFQPAMSLWIFLTGCITHFILLTLNLDAWLFLTDIPMAAIALLHSIRWRIQHSFSNRLLAVLHMAFFWLFIGLSLFSLQSLLLQFSDIYILNKAPLHAITIGFFASLLIAMASRVTLGHSGRMLVLDTMSWYLFIGIQLAAIARIFADLQYDHVLINHNFNLIAIALWLLSMSIWFIKYAPIYLSGRIDGKEG